MKYKGNIVKKVRKEKRMSRTQLSDITGIPVGTLVNIECMTCDTVGFSVLNRIALALNCGVVDFIYDGELLELRPRDGLPNCDMELLEEYVREHCITI